MTALAEAHRREQMLHVRDAIDVLSRMAFVRDPVRLTSLERRIIDWALGVLTP